MNPPRKDDLSYMTRRERQSYESGGWLGSLECDNCGEDLYDDHDCPVIGTWVRVTRTQVP